MLIALMILFPMAAAPVVWLIGRKRQDLTEIAAGIVTVAELVLAALLWLLLCGINRGYSGRAAFPHGRVPERILPAGGAAVVLYDAFRPAVFPP